jgi:hypothetical protein
LEWFNLTAIHGEGYLLHDDFYNQDGVAEQPKEEVESPELYPAPSLNEVRDDLERLIDFAITRYQLKRSILSALKQHNKKDLLNALQRRVDRYPSLSIEGTAYEICARVLGSAAQEWIRQRWQVYNPNILFSLAEATASCLPFDEGYARVVNALMDVPPQELADQSSALAWFRSEKTLDWLENHTAHMVNNWGHVTATWGQLAALSQLSWSRVVAWLDKGRPLSLVALDALKDFYWYNTGLLKRFKPKLLDPAPTGEMEAKLRDYERKDAVPRVERDVAQIIEEMKVASET